MAKRASKPEIQEKNQNLPNEQNHTNPEITFFAIIKLGFHSPLLTTA